MGMSGQRHAPAALYPRFPLDRRQFPEPVWTQGLEKKSSAPVGDRAPIFQPVVRHYTDWATAAPHEISTVANRCRTADTRISSTCLFCGKLTRSWCKIFSPKEALGADVFWKVVACLLVTPSIPCASSFLWNLANCTYLRKSTQQRETHPCLKHNSVFFLKFPNLMWKIKRNNRSRIVTGRWKRGLRPFKPICIAEQKVNCDCGSLHLSSSLNNEVPVIFSVIDVN
jgi:hypothetical protein